MANVVSMYVPAPGFNLGAGTNNYSFEIANTNVLPSAYTPVLLWSSIDFEDFTNPGSASSSSIAVIGADERNIIRSKKIAANSMFGTVQNNGNVGGISFLGTASQTPYPMCCTSGNSIAIGFDNTSILLDGKIKGYIVGFLDDVASIQAITATNQNLQFVGSGLNFTDPTTGVVITPNMLVLTGVNPTLVIYIIGDPVNNYSPISFLVTGFDINGDPVSQTIMATLVSPTLGAINGGTVGDVTICLIKFVTSIQCTNPSIPGGTILVSAGTANLLGEGTEIDIPAFGTTELESAEIFSGYKDYNLLFSTQSSSTNMPNISFEVVYGNPANPEIGFIAGSSNDPVNINGNIYANNIVSIASQNAFTIPIAVSPLNNVAISDAFGNGLLSSSTAPYLGKNGSQLIFYSQVGPHSGAFTVNGISPAGALINETINLTPISGRNFVLSTNVYQFITGFSQQTGSFDSMVVGALGYFAGFQTVSGFSQSGSKIVLTSTDPIYQQINNFVQQNPSPIVVQPGFPSYPPINSYSNNLQYSTNIVLSSTVDNTAVIFAIAGEDFYGNFVGEQIAGPNLNAPVYSANQYYILTSITANQPFSFINVSIGGNQTSQWFSLDPMEADSQLSFQANIPLAITTTNATGVNLNLTTDFLLCYGARSQPIINTAPIGKPITPTPLLTTSGIRVTNYAGGAQFIISNNQPVTPGGGGGANAPAGPITLTCLQTGV